MFKKLILAAALGGTALAGTAYAAQDQAAPPPPPAGMHHHHRGHGDMLAKLDTNHDGVITRAEAMAAADAKFAKLDTNGDGQITRAEIQAKQDARRAKWQERRAARADQPQGAPQPGTDGQHPHMGHGMHRPGGRHGDMMKRLDTNNDGVITKAEAEAAAMQRFDKMDANHDGRIDQTEIAAIKAKMDARRAEMRAKWQERRAAQAPADQPAGE